MVMGTIATVTIGCALGLGIGWLMHREALRAAERQAKDTESRLSEVEGALATNHDRLEQAMHGSRLAMWELDMRTGQVNLSANWFALMGGIPRESPIPIEELIDRVPDGQQADCWTVMRSVLRGSASFYDVEHRVRRDDGSFAWIHSRGIVSERSADGRVLRMTGTNLDITTRKSAEDAMGESEARLRLIADELPFTAAILDTELRVVFANRHMGDAFEAKPESMAGRSLHAIAGADTEALVRSRMSDLRSGATCVIAGSFGEMRLVPQLEEGSLVRIGLLGSFPSVKATLSRPAHPSSSRETP
jgi:PAS domain-containing protein